MSNYIARRYQAMDIGAMSGPRLLLMVYAQIVAALRKGHAAILAGDHEGRSQALCRARDLIHELATTLDRQTGGQLAENLLGLYEYFVREITQIDFRPDAPRLSRVTDLVVTLQEAWNQAAQDSEASLPVAASQ